MNTGIRILEAAHENRGQRRQKQSIPTSIGASMASPFAQNHATDMSNAAEQYRAASRGYAFTSIRPIAVKAASQPLRIGVIDASAQVKRMAAKLRFRKNYASLRDYGMHDLSIANSASLHEKILNDSPSWIKSMMSDVRVLDEHPALASFRDPNPYMSSWALMYCTIFSLEATGQAIWILDTRDDGLLDIWYTPVSWCRPIHDGKNLFAQWKVAAPGTASEGEPIDGRLVIHFFLPNPGNPLLPHSNLSAQATAINTDDEMVRSQFHLVRNMQRPSMLITLGELTGVDGKKAGRPELTDKQRQELIQSVRRHYMTAAKFGDPMVLDRVVSDVRPYMPGLVDLDWPNGGRVTKERIMEGIGTNPIVVGAVQGSNRASAWVAHDSVNMMKVNPLLVNMAQTITSRWSDLFDEPNLRLWFDDARAKDPDLIHRRVQLVASAGAMTNGELRHYGATGDFEAVPREDDDERIAIARDRASVNPRLDIDQPPRPEGKVPVDKNDIQGKKAFDPWMLAELDLKQTYTPPRSAQANARKVLQWKREHQDEVKGMTSVGWARARQLASGKPVSMRTVSRMSAFNRHRSNYEKARAKQKQEGGKPWQYAGIVAWLGWGGTTGVDWARQITGAKD